MNESLTLKDKYNQNISEIEIMKKLQMKKGYKA